MNSTPRFLLFILLFFTLSANGQSGSETTEEATETEEKHIRLFALPLVFYGPETRLGFGAAGVAAFDWKKSLPTDRPSQVQLGFAYTLNKQLLFYIPYQFFTPGEQWSFSGELGYYKYFFYYYGNGFSALDMPEETYNVNFPRLRFRSLYQLKQQHFVGIQYWYDDFRNLEYRTGGILDVTQPIGVNGGRVSGLGPVYLLDTRNNIFSPDKGSYIEVSTLINAPWLGSDFSFQKLILDARTYISKKPEQVLALQLYGEFTSGEPPFFQLAQLGGNKRLRGYIEGRVRDNQYLMVQAEFRQHLFWRIGMTAFVAYGGVAEKISALSPAQSVWAAGLGLRVLLLKEDRINVRFDAGFGKKTSGYYLTVTEAF
ncbi:MAG: BamA/TamA family outer membrane protein [Saprospiraceae bacterium]|nr:BamA/TamA family outer membrane protein [Saprospiraceae bacterium]